MQEGGKLPKFEYAKKQESVLGKIKSLFYNFYELSFGEI